MTVIDSSFVSNASNALLGPLMTLWDNIRLLLPNIIAGLLILIVGYIVGSAFGLILHRFLDHAKIDEHIRKAGVHHSIGFISVASLAAGLLKWYIFALFLEPVAEILKLGAISILLKKFALWIPDLAAGIIILLVGLIIADYLADRLLHAKRKGVRLFSAVVRWLMILFVALTALNQVGVDVSFATNTTLIIVAGFAVGISIALGIGFGLALKDEAKAALKGVKKALK